ncbi:MAG: serine/threonine-protein kinase [Actinomadura sp.]
MDPTADPFPTESDLTRQFPGYRILQRISQTAMSSVFLAEEIRLRRRVVLKVLNGELANDAGFHERFRREVAIAARLDHPNVIPVYASGESEEGVLYLVLRYVNGGDLGSLLRAEGRFDIARTAHFIGQMAAALNAAHRVGLVHRDVKPSNVLVDADSGHLYLCDFGIAKQVNTNETITGTNQFVGTTDYASPEQITGGAIDRRTDIYALGCVLFQCLTGAKPFSRTDSMAVLWAHLQDPPPRVSAFRPDVPPRVDGIVQRALAKRPDDRYPTCAALVADLNSAIAVRPPEFFQHQGRPGTANTQPVRHRAGALRGTLRRRWQVLCAGAGTVLLVAALAAVGIRAMSGVDQETLDLIPAALRGTCAERDPGAGQEAAAEALTCTDGSGFPVSFAVFDSRRDLLTAYDEAVRGSGIARGTGDCSSMTGAEHRYPAAGAPAGRLLCFARESSTSLVWTDDRSSILARADGAQADTFKLQQAWNAWTRAPAFPAPEEKALLDILREEDCRRAPAGSFDRYSDVVAGVECPPDDEGADRVGYYRFASLDGLRRSHSGHVAENKVTSNDVCFQGDGKGTLSNSTWSVMSIDMGQLMCVPGRRGQGPAVVEWTDEPVLLAGRAEGAEINDLADWWNGSSSPLNAVRAKAINAQARPVFPTPAERSLLGFVPSDFRDTCVRPAERELKQDVPDIAVTAVRCVPSGDPNVVSYYQFADVASMKKNYGDRRRTGRDCEVKKSKAVGDSSYTVDDKPGGRLWCGEDGDGDWYMTWYDEVLKIQAVAEGFSDPAESYPWWLDDSGPVRNGD